MAKLLYLVHRLPYPPNKGDKVRSFNLLRHLAQRHQVYLGCFVDDAEDLARLAEYRQVLEKYCAAVCILPLSPRQARLCSLRALLTGEALSLPYYRQRAMQNWVDGLLAESSLKIDAAVIFSSPMAQYVATHDVPALVDFVDLDSDKWTQYADRHAWPMSWIYRREGEKLLAFERQTALQARHSFFVTDNECQLFLERAPEAAGRVSAVCNGVDAEFFSPEHALASPYPNDEIPLVFTGAMDYWPNVDAVRWFAHEIFPRLQQHQPQLRFYIVGRNPTADVQALAVNNSSIIVTATVPDVRPYLLHAALVVAPLRLARGIQNKVLEAMACARPVIASTTCATPIDAVIGRDFLAAEAVEEWQQTVLSLLDDPQRAKALGLAARQQILARYSWDAHLSAISDYLEQLNPAAVNVETAVEKVVEIAGEKTADGLAVVKIEANA